MDEQPSAHQVELELRDAVRDGRPAFKGPPWMTPDGEMVHRPLVPAALIKELVVGSHGRGGVQVFGATIEGDLELRTAQGPSGGACNILKLEDCELRGSDPANRAALDARESHLSLLSLIDCRVTGIDVSSAVIDGDLILDGLQIAASDGDSTLRGYGCWVRARGARIEGSVSASGSQFGLPRVQPAKREESESLLDVAPPTLRAKSPRGRVAFDFHEARIEGSMNLREGFTSLGSVDIQGAKIGGDFVVSGADLRAARRSDDDALRAQDVHIKGRVLVETREETDMDPSLPVRVSGPINFQGASLDGPVSVADPIWDNADKNSGYVLDAGNTRFGSTVDLVNIGRAINLAGSIVHDDLTVRGDPVAITVLEASRIKVHGSVTVGGIATGLVDFTGSVIDGDLGIGDWGWFIIDDQAEGHPEIRLVGATVGRRLRVNPITTRTDPVVDWATVAMLRLRSTKLDCYPGWRLGQALLRADPGSDLACLSFLYHPDKVDPRNISVLDGESAPMHAHNGRPEAPLVLDTPERVQTYLAFFCDNLWGEAETYTLIDGTISVPKRRGWTWSVKAALNSEGHTTGASFYVRTSGNVCMFDETPIGPRREDQPIRIANGVRWIRVPRTATNGSIWPRFPTLAGPWDDLVGAKRTAIWEAVREAIQRQDRSAWESHEAALGSIGARPKIDLSGLTVGSLSDEDGVNWSELTEVSDRSSTSPGRWPRSARHWRSKVRLELAGFGYGRIDERNPSHDDSSRTDRLTSRQDWLSAQYAEDEPSRAEYNPQPYQQLAMAFRSSGDYGHADAVTFEKLRTERIAHDHQVVAGWPRAMVWASALLFAVLFLMIVVGQVPNYGLVPVAAVGLASSVLLLLPTKDLKKLFFEIPFGYGLRTWSAFLTFAIFLIVGWAAVEFFAPLKLDTSAAGTVVTTSAGQLIPIVQIQAVPVDQQKVEVACDQKDSLLYALDVMLPLDLRQEARCKMSSVDGLTESMWRTAKGLYAVGGWIVVSGLILTVSGVVRRQAEK